MSQFRVSKQINRPAPPVERPGDSDQSNADFEAVDIDALNARVIRMRRALLHGSPADVVRLVNETVPERAKRAAERLARKTA